MPSRLALATARCSTTGARAGPEGSSSPGRPIPRRSPSASPRMRSLRPKPYTSAVSNRVTPRSTARRTMSRATAPGVAVPVAPLLRPELPGAQADLGNPGGRVDVQIPHAEPPHGECLTIVSPEPRPGPPVRACVRAVGRRLLSAGGRGSPAWRCAPRTRLCRVTKFCSENCVLTLYSEGGGRGALRRAIRPPRSAPRGRPCAGCRSSRAPSGNGRWQGARTGGAEPGHGRGHH